MLPLLLLAPAWGQVVRPVSVLQRYLELADSQVETILRNNEDYNRYSREKQNRIAQVQSEIAEETAKESLDPAALGIRYAEIEVHCRQLKEEAARTRNLNMAALSDAQKTKLKALEEAVKLLPVISEAEWTNLLGTYSGPPFLFNSTTARTDGARLGTLIPGVAGCSPAVTTRWFDASTFQPPQP